MKTIENRTEIYHKALKSMPINFTSHLFVNKLRKSGIAKNEIDNNAHYYFLINQDIPRLSKFRWQKKKEENQITLQDQPKAQPQMSDEQMIEHLKSKGYKVLKSTWNEL